MFQLFKNLEDDSLFIISLKLNSTLYQMAYEATLYDNKLHKAWVGHIVTNQQQAGFTYSQTDELVFEATADEIVNQIIKDGVILKGD